MVYLKTQLLTFKTHVVNLKHDVKDLSRDLQRLEVRDELRTKTLISFWESFPWFSYRNVCNSSVEPLTIAARY